MKILILGALIAAVLSVQPVIGQASLFGNLKGGGAIKVELFENKLGNIVSVPRHAAVDHGARVKMRITITGDNTKWKHFGAQFDFGSGQVTGPDITAPPGKAITLTPAIIESPWADLKSPSIKIRFESIGVTSNHRDAQDDVYHVSFKADKAPSLTLAPDTKVTQPSGPKLELASIVMPNFTGQTPDEAQAKLTALHFRGQVLRQMKQARSAANRGKILGQDPAPGASVPQSGRNVTLVVGEGAAVTTVPMPNLVGLSALVVPGTLASAGFHGKIERQGKPGPDRAQENKVIAQAIPPGTGLGPDTVVKIMVYDYSFVMPRIVGLPEEAATAALIKAGWHVGKPAATVSTRKPALPMQSGFIAEQVPAPGQLVPPAGPIGWTKYKN